VDDWNVHDFAALKAAAARDAVAKARAEAEQIASASGLKVGAILRIEDANSRASSADAGLAEAAMAAVERRNLKPQVPIDVKPEPVEASAIYAVTFSIAP
jgi:uncharacterized protein YggE